MRVFVPRRSQQKNEGNPPEPSVKSAKSLPAPPFGTFDQPEAAQLQKINALESNRDPVSAPLEPRTPAHLKKMQAAPDQPRPAQTLTGAATLEPLPLELRAIVRAAGAGTLPKGEVNLETGFTVDLERYVLGFAAQYLTGDQTHAILELRACSRAWQTMTRKAVSA